MKLNKKVIESMTVASALLVMTTITAFGGSTEDSTSNVTRSVALGKNGTAGIVFQLHDMEADVMKDGSLVVASIEKVQKDIVSESGEQQVTSVEAAVENAISPEEAEWENRVMADVEEDMNIRTAPNANSQLSGKLYRGDVADVVSVEGEWTQITSGNVTGYVKNEYLVYGMEANALANEVCSLYATVNADALRLRSEPSEVADVVETAANGDKLKVDKEAEAVEGWVAVQTPETTAYVSAEYVNVALNLGTALTTEEVAEKEAKGAGITKKEAKEASVDDVILLGALIQCEAGNGSYEGMLAVGSVVMNRVRSGAYPGTISGVIYQGGQFPPATNGSVAGVISCGVSGVCLQAAKEAISGVDNTNGATCFRSAASGCSGTVIGANVFF